MSLVSSPRNAPPAHDVHNALTVIIGSAGLLQEFHRALGPADIELLAAGILEAAVRLNRMADAAAGGVDAEGAPVRPSPRLDGASGSSTFADVRAAAREAAFGAGRLADLELDLGDVPVTVPPALLRKVVSTLVRDAFRLSDRGTRVRVGLRADGSGCRIEITDRRPPMAASPRRRKLAAARRIAESTGGELEVDRRQAQATTVRVRWGDPGRRHSVRIRIPCDSRA
jgi:signal transduction histidine kinase